MPFQWQPGSCFAIAGIACVDHVQVGLPEYRKHVPDMRCIEASRDLAIWQRRIQLANSTGLAHVTAACDGSAC
jgi:hypothetical protein